MKIGVLTLALLGLVGLSHGLDMSSIINGMLDNAIDKAGSSETSGSSGTSSGSGSSSGSGTSSSSSSSGTSSSSSSSSGSSNSGKPSSSGNSGSGGFMSQLGTQALDQILPAVKDFVVNTAKTFFDKLLGGQLNRNYHDDILMHRAVRVYKTGDKSVTILDRTSGLKVAGQGANIEEAIENATKTLIETLLTTGQMSLLDLGLPEPTKPVVIPCVDNFNRDFCKDMKRRGFCEAGHHMALFTLDYCRKTCTSCQ